MKDFDEIIRERTAGLPLKQAMEVALQALREALITQPDVPLTLTGMARVLVVLGLEQRLPPKEQAKIERQRLLRNIDQSREFAKWAKKNIWPKGGQKLAALEAVQQWCAFKDPTDLSSRFPTVEALEQFIKRARTAKKKPQR
jgi:hypothetical protein